MSYSEQDGQVTPKRIQRRRTKGWKMPPNTICVTRPSIFGNPFIVCVGGWTPEEAQDLFKRFVKRAGELPLPLHHPYIPVGRIEELRGKNLACWCSLCEKHRDGKPLNEVCPDCSPCHVDVLGEILYGV